VRLAAARIEPRNGRLLHIAGSAAAGDLAGALRAHGFEVDRSVLYQARPVPALSAPATRALSAGEIDFVLLFSPRTAAIFARLVVAAGIAPDLDGAAALSISATANRALDGLPWHERLVAERPDQRALLDLLDRLLAKRRPG
jgi:uroporphyrinogen-III synthase